MNLCCEHCGREFKRESSLLAHCCEHKRRWDQRDTVASKLALAAYQRFYQRFQPSARPRDWQQFSTSRYYTAFIRFAQYTQDVKCVNTDAYIDYVLKHRIPLDRWPQDSVYEKFMLEWTRIESVWDAVRRSLLTAAEWSDQQNISLTQYFRCATDSRIIGDIIRGRISAWLIYASADGIGWLHKLNAEQQQLIYPWIDPDHWSKKLKQCDELDQVRGMLENMGM
jgi:hypothetical protein